jgi:hypothetical protein
MGFAERKVLYQEIEAKRDRPVIAYVTSSRPNAQAQMASDVIPRIAEQVRCVAPEHTAIDLLIVSNGGDPTVAWRIVSVLRERFANVGVLLPFSAFSAATLLALGADEVVMHPFANLGPVDMQLTQRRRVSGPDGHPTGEIEEVTFGSEDVRHFLEFLRADVGITDQAPLERAFELAIRDVGAIAVGSAKRGTNLALSMGEKLLGLHMDDKNQAKAIAESFNSAFYHHGYPVGRREAAEAGLNVIKAEDLGLDDALWSVWTDVSTDMAMDTPFDPLVEVMKDPKLSQQLTTLPQVNLPAGLPPVLAQQAHQQILAQIQVTSQAAKDYDLFLATVESPRCRSEFRQTGKLNAVRLADMNLQVMAVRTGVGWQSKEVDAKVRKGKRQEETT